MRPRVVALTGTPGTGKSTVAAALRAQGHGVVRLGDLAARFRVGTDRARRTAVVDVAALSRWLRPRATGANAPRAWKADRAVFDVPETWWEPDVPARNRLLVVEGHFAHDLRWAPRVVVLRLDPRVVERRLRRRGYAKAKARENAEAEAVGVIAGECLRDRRATEVDVTGLTRADAARRVLRAARARTVPRVGRVDWADAVLAW